MQIKANAPENFALAIGAAAIESEASITRTNEGVVLQACSNGGLSKARHPRVPVTALELAIDALLVREAGADELHIHVRDRDGAETLDSASVAVRWLPCALPFPAWPWGSAPAH